MLTKSGGGAPVLGVMPEAAGPAAGCSATAGAEPGSFGPVVGLIGGHKRRHRLDFAFKLAFGLPEVIAPLEI